MTLSCCKTGRWWPVEGRREADRLARTLGLPDYETVPALAVER